MTRILVLLGCLLWLPQVVAAQSDSTASGLRLGFAQPALSLQQPAVLRAPWMGAPRSTPALRLAAFDRALAAKLAADRAARAAGLRLLTLYGTPFEPTTELAEGEEVVRRRNPLGLPSKYADLTLDGQARLEDEIVRRVDVGTVTFQPPPSRFITAAVPANNFGVNAIFDLGPIQLQTLAATAGVTWQPLGMLSASGDLASNRDLRVYPVSTPIGKLAFGDRDFLFGIPVGVERDRSLVTAVALTPARASWLRPRLLSNSSFILSRTLTSRDPVPARRRWQDVRLAQDAEQFAEQRAGRRRGPCAGAPARRRRQRHAGQAVGTGPAAGLEHPPHPDVHLRSHRVRAERRVPARPRRARPVSGPARHPGAGRVRLPHCQPRERRGPAAGLLVHALARAHPHHPVPAGGRVVHPDRDPAA